MATSAVGHQAQVRQVILARFLSALSIAHMVLFGRSLYFAIASMGMASLRRKLDPAALIDYWDSESSNVNEEDKKLEGMFG
jgi:hypothetical protein